MATETVRYITYTEAVLIHIELMRLEDEIRYGVFDRELIESALARPRQAAAYESADILRQAATLCYSLIKNHPWVGGNKGRPPRWSAFSSNATASSSLPLPKTMSKCR